MFFETNTRIGLKELQEIAQKTGVNSQQLVVVYANTDSLVGRINASAGSVETLLRALHTHVEERFPDDKQKQLEFLKGITKRTGSCCLTPAKGKDHESFSATNDAMRNANVELSFDDTPVSYTHLTLPTKA